MIWKMLHPKMTEAMLGMIPHFLSERDPRPAAMQFAERYAHGGGWNAIEGFKKAKANPEDFSVKYPGDTALRPLAMTTLNENATRRAEVVVFYEGAWVAIWQPNGEFEVSRMD